MPEVNARIAQIGALLASETPFERLTGTVYLDAQAVIQWIRLNVFEEILELLPIGTNYLRRFRIQDAAYNEILGVLVRKLGIGSYPEVATYLKSHPNLQVDGPLESASPVGKRALALQLQMCIQAREDPAQVGNRHLGEAETLAIIEHYERGAIFVTADKGAITVARDTGVAHIVRPSAFTGGVMRTRDDVIGVWKHTCLARRCVFDDDWNLDCVDVLECNDLSEESAARSPISPLHLRAADTLDWAHADLQGLVQVLAAKGD